MGQFSWIYSDTDKQMLDNRKADSYLLVPPAYHNKYGEYILETCYDGYGEFGRYDVYDLIPEWNKDFIPTLISLAKKGEWVCSVNAKDEENLLKFYHGEAPSCEVRWLGIIMACYDEDNERLPYPIKITTKPMRYDFAKASESDPNQGWEVEEDEDEWY